MNRRDWVFSLTVHAAAWWDKEKRKLLLPQVTPSTELPLADRLQAQFQVHLAIPTGGLAHCRPLEH